MFREASAHTSLDGGGKPACRHNVNYFISDSKCVNTLDAPLIPTGVLLLIPVWFWRCAHMKRSTIARNGSIGAEQQVCAPSKVPHRLGVGQFSEIHNDTYNFRSRNFRHSRKLRCPQDLCISSIFYSLWPQNQQIRCALKTPNEHAYGASNVASKQGIESGCGGCAVRI